MAYAGKAAQRLAGSTNYEGSEATLNSNSVEMTNMSDSKKPNLTGGRLAGKGKQTDKLTGGSMGVGGRKNSGALTGGRIGGGMSQGKKR